ncbi:SMI1/KNR4 family protein [Parashewanella spongiae]|uniref:SMI1/KNR4 family protein n=1 Tax=Parashewanella spongiae TaxID=342950 RepID=A0A3A6TNI4_9GAMM|nr:SMI1/KNR4 family protein [Parashewanella spongiae]MCL1079995.1 SMI1/KNR4 family protein [Parashewanella spongiae]RJY06175.1 SMI1/KNR4 family protein [Parashewanella spongiae]
MNEIIEQLQEANQATAFPLELPTFEQLVEVEEQILIPLPKSLKTYLLEASDVIFGHLEPVTAADTYAHTYLPEVTSYAWSVGMPREYIAVCQQGEDFYCIDQSGQILLWKDGRLASKSWETLWHWIDEVWLKN